MSTDEVARIKELAHAIEKKEAELAELGSQRRDAVKALREDGWSYARIAEALGVTRSRVQQLSK